MRPERCVGNGKRYSQSQRKGQKLHSTHLRMYGVYQRHPSKIPEERELVVDSRASMHMLSRKDLNSAELDTVRVSRNPTTVITANGEVQTNEEAQVYDRDFDLFVTAQIFVDTAAVLSLGKLCEDPGYFISIKMQLGELRAYRCSGFVQPDFRARLRVHPSTSVPQDSMRDDSTPCPADTRSRSKRSPLGRLAARFQTNQQTKIKLRTAIEHGEARCVICRNGCRNSLII